jgi:hypothetical protein
MPAGTGQNRAGLGSVRTGLDGVGLGPVWFLFGWAVSAPPDKANKPKQLNDLANTLGRYLPFTACLSLSLHSYGHFATRFW